MNPDLRYELVRCETDVDETLRRFSGDETLYLRCLGLFLQDTTLMDLSRSIRGGEWDGAFTAAHALKGVAGNMGFVPLYHASAEMVVLIRSGRIGQAEAAYREIERCYAAIIAAIRPYVSDAEGALR